MHKKAPHIAGLFCVGTEIDGAAMSGVYDVRPAGDAVRLADAPAVTGQLLLTEAGRVLIVTHEMLPAGARSRISRADRPGRSGARGAAAQRHRASRQQRRR